MNIRLPFPAEALWPNARPHWSAKHRATKAARWDASWAALGAGAQGKGAPTAITIHLYPKPKGPPPDRDNITAALKASLDGLADTLGANDRLFPAPGVVIHAERLGRVEIELAWPLQPAAC